MSDTPTPRTDAAIQHKFADYGMVTADFARDLEREITRLRLALTGVSTCSTCEMCRNVARKALE